MKFQYEQVPVRKFPFYTASGLSDDLLSISLICNNYTHLIAILYTTPKCNSQTHTFTILYGRAAMSSK